MVLNFELLTTEVLDFELSSQDVLDFEVTSEIVIKPAVLEEITLDVTENGTYTLEPSTGYDGISSATVNVNVEGGTPYQGEYEATPSMEEQTFETQGKTLSQNFIVHKIPSNYGLITYNGFEIMVS